MKSITDTSINSYVWITNDISINNNVSVAKIRITMSIFFPNGVSMNSNARVMNTVSINDISIISYAGISVDKIALVILWTPKR